MFDWGSSEPEQWARNLDACKVDGLPKGLRISRPLTALLFRAGWADKDYTETEGVELQKLLNTLPSILRRLIQLEFPDTPETGSEIMAEEIAQLEKVG